MEDRLKQFAELRQRAESVLLEPPPLESITHLTPEEIQTTVHNLRVHQVELEMQNDDLRRALVDLDVARARYLDFFNLAPVGYFTISSTGLILETNLTAASLLGLPQSELIDQPLTNFIHQQDQDLYYLFRKLLLGHEAVKPCDLRVVRGDNAVFWARLRAVAVQDADGSPVYRLILSDITEYKHAEEAVQRNESRLRRLVDILQHPSDTIQGFLDYVLEQAIQLTGSKIGYIYHYHEDRKELVLNSWSKEVLPACAVVNPQTCYALEKTGIWGEAVRQRRPLIVNDFPAANPLQKGYPEGHVHLSKFVTIPIFKGERIVSVVGLANKETDYDETDILQISLLMDAVWKVTDSMQAHMENAKLQTQLIQSQKMEAIGTLAGGIAHDFNNILGVILGYTEIARGDMPTESSVAQSLDKVLEASHRAATLRQADPYLQSSGEGCKRPSGACAHYQGSARASPPFNTVNHCNQTEDCCQKQAHSCRSDPGAPDSDQSLHQCRPCHGADRWHP